MPHPGHGAHTANEHDAHAHVHSPIDQGICAGLSRWGTAPSCVSGVVWCQSVHSSNNAVQARAAS
eukprot:384566-Prymnesium_polylepis.2